jgi:hypothetical protein
VLLAIIIAPFEMAMPPPTALHPGHDRAKKQYAEAAFPLIVLLAMFKVPEAEIPPPLATPPVQVRPIPCAHPGAETLFPLIVLLVIVNVPSLMTPPPPAVPPMHMALALLPLIVLLLIVNVP